MDPLTLARIGVGAAVALVGLVFVLGGALGLLRFPDLYTRLHAASVSDAPGAALFVVGLAIMAPDWALALRLGLLAVLIIALAPVLAHLLGAAAHSGGLAPIAGRYTAPRPGAQRQEEA